MCLPAVLGLCACHTDVLVVDACVARNDTAQSHAEKTQEERRSEVISPASYYTTERTPQPGRLLIVSLRLQDLLSFRVG